MAECLFCKIVAGEIPATIVFQNEEVTAFRDINPQAPTHILIVPNAHIASVGAMSAQQAPVMGAMALAAIQIADQAGLGQLEAGYRLVINYGADGGMTVHHLHMHLLGGRALGWPPG